jgi:hypothetical protein
MSPLTKRRNKLHRPLGDVLLTMRERPTRSGAIRTFF